MRCMRDILGYDESIDAKQATVNSRAPEGECPAGSKFRQSKGFDLPEGQGVSSRLRIGYGNTVTTPLQMRFDSD